jgi:single-stranded DNA-binding protein
MAKVTLAERTVFSNAAYVRVTPWVKGAETDKLSVGNETYDITEVVADNVEFLGSRNSSTSSNNMNSSASNAGPTPYDFGDAPEPKGTDIDSNPYADFGASIEISDDELPF